MSCIHASCVSIGESAVLLRGAPGSGKSDLALRLIDGGGRLVADDQVLLTRDGSQVIARPPKTIGGLLEVRGLGIIKVPYRSEAVLVLVVDVTPAEADERLPAPDHCRIEGIDLPRLIISARRASADAIVRLALRALEENGSLAGALGDAGATQRRVSA